MRLNAQALAALGFLRVVTNQASPRPSSSCLPHGHFHGIDTGATPSRDQASPRPSSALVRRMQYGFQSKISALFYPMRFMH